MKLLHHLIRTNKEVIGESLANANFNVIQQIKYYLIKIRNLSDLDVEDVLVQLA